MEALGFTLPGSRATTVRQPSLALENELEAEDPFVRYKGRWLTAGGVCLTAGGVLIIESVTTRGDMTGVAGALAMGMGAMFGGVTLFGKSGQETTEQNSPPFEAPVGREPAKRIDF